jgi:hypothetical protein
MVSILIACICQFAERFAVAHRGGKLRAEADSVNSTRTDERKSTRCSQVRIDHASGCAEIFSNTLVLFFAPTRALHFSSQENFFFAIENKIHFFLVGFATDF